MSVSLLANLTIEPVPMLLGKDSRINGMAMMDRMSLS
jgi:hypothetical protein